MTQFDHPWAAPATEMPAMRRRTCPYCGIPNDPPSDSLFSRISEQHNRCKVCGDVVSNSTEGRDAHLAEKGCHVLMTDDPKGMQFNGLTSYLAICEWARPFAGSPDHNTLSLEELFRFEGGKRPLMLVRGREGVMPARVGDWVVMDDNFEFSVRTSAEVEMLRSAVARLMRHQAKLAEALDLGEDDDLSAELVNSRDEAKRALGR